MHLEYIRNINRQIIREENTFLRLARRNLKEETESEIIATQDQALQIKYHAKNVKKKHSKCYDETIDYIVSAFLILVKEYWVKRHDRLCAQLRFNIWKDVGHWHGNATEPAETCHENKVTVLWTRQVYIERTVLNNNPDTVIRSIESEYIC